MLLAWLFRSLNLRVTAYYILAPLSSVFAIDESQLGFDQSGNWAMDTQ
jgi:hypothetical protein